MHDLYILMELMTNNINIFTLLFVFNVDYFIKKKFFTAAYRTVTQISQQIKQKFLLLSVIKEKRNYLTRTN